MKKTIQYLSLFTLLLFISCGSDATEEIESVTSINTSLQTISFSETEINTSSELTFNVSNTGNTDIDNASIVNSNSVFTISPATFSLSKNQSKTFTITFTPTQVQNYTDTFSLKLGQTILSSINVNGDGITATPITSIQSSKTSLNFNDVTINNTIQLSLVISNNGNQNINAITVNNTVSEFSVSPTSFPLNTEATKTINISFTPTQVQNYNDVITFKTENTILASVSLSGNGSQQAPLTTYTKDIKPIMTANCTSCHGSSGGVSLETFTATKNAFVSRGALSQIELGEMPRNANKLPQTEIDLIKKWIADGYPE